jgi:ABC-type transporter Mla MlaB component
VVEFERAAEGVRLTLRGRLDEATLPLLDGALDALQAEATPVLLDLAGVEHIDRLGLKLMFDAEAKARRSGRSLDVIGVPESLRERHPPDVE